MRNSDNDGIYRSTRAQDMAIARREYPNQESKLVKLTDKNLKFIVDELRKQSSPRNNKLRVEKVRD